MSPHAVDITLNRPATADELAAARRTMPLAAHHDRTHLLALVRAKTPHRALHRARRDLDSLLPIDTLTTHYPDANGQVLLNVDFTPESHLRIQQDAAQAGQSPDAYLHGVLIRALAHAEREQTERLDAALDQLLIRTTPERLLAAAARKLTPTPPNDGARRC